MTDDIRSAVAELKTAILKLSTETAGEAREKLVEFADIAESCAVDLVTGKLSFDQATALGFPSIDGGAAQLGDALGLANWKEAGDVGRDAMNKAVFAALKSGGMYVIADHAGRPGTGISESGTLHRIEEAFLRKEVESAGFSLSEGLLQ